MLKVGLPWFKGRNTFSRFISFYRDIPRCSTMCYVGCCDVYHGGTVYMRAVSNPVYMDPDGHLYSFSGALSGKEARSMLDVWLRNEGYYLL